MNKIIPKRYNTLNCIENCFANICDAYGIDYRPLFLFSWDFGYDTTKTTIGERVHYRHNRGLGIDDYVEIAFKYLNIHCVKQPAEHVLNKSQTENSQIYLIGADSFNCKWNLAYHKYHYPHYFLMEKTDMRGGENIVVIDSFSSLDIHHITRDRLNTINTLHRICISENTIDTTLEQKNLMHSYLEFISSNVQNRVYDKIKTFAYELLNVNDISELSPQITDIANAFIVRRLSYIVNSRYNSILLLEYLDLNEISPYMKSIHEQWETIKNLFIRILISKNTNKIVRASELIMNVAHDENSLATRLLGG